MERFLSYLFADATLPVPPRLPGNWKFVDG
jgi:hypothetical protein